LNAQITAHRTRRESLPLRALLPSGFGGAKNRAQGGEKATAPVFQH
jgi:hypothetical protein